MKHAFKNTIFSILVFSLSAVAFSATQPMIHGGWNYGGSSKSVSYYQTLFQRANNLGMKYILISHVAVNGNALYYSDIFPRASGLTHDMVETVLSLADSYGMKVFVGNGYFNENKAVFTNTESKQAMTEIAAKYSHHASFYGWYHSVERSLSSDGTWGYSWIYKEMGNFARQITPNAKIMIAPYGTRYYNGNTQLASQLAASVVDIVAYQDEVGVQRATPEQTRETFARLRALHDTIPSVALWADVEVFDFNPYYSPTRDFDRFKSQLESVAPYVDQIIIWELDGPFGYVREQAFYDNYIGYLNSISTPDTTPPSRVASINDGTGTDIDSTSSTSQLSANWTVSTDAESYVSYKYAIGTSAGGTNVVGWTANSGTGVTKAGLTLTVGKRYYFTVKAVSAGGESAATNSDGVLVEAGSAPPSDNIALAKTVTVSSVESSNSAESAADGNTATRWGSEFSDPQWIYVDLGDVYSVNKVILNWEVAYGKSYEIQVSPDGADWMQVYATTGGDGGVDEINFTATDARYVRMYGTVRGTQYGYSLWEFEVYGEPAGQDGPVISNVQTENITQTGATITWDTDIPATSQVEYGLTAGYGGATAEDTELVTNHTVVLKGLSAGTQYHFGVKSDGVISADYTFTTIENRIVIDKLDVRVYPNPYIFTGSNPVTFSVSGATGADISIYTISGKLVKKLQITSGQNEIDWNIDNEIGNDITNGLYIYVIVNDQGNRKTGKFVITK
jgi:hypothetical protein